MIIKNGMEDGFDYGEQSQFWDAMNTYYRNTFAGFDFFEVYKEGVFNYNAGGVIAVGACMP